MATLLEARAAVAVLKHFVLRALGAVLACAPPCHDATAFKLQADACMV